MAARRVATKAAIKASQTTQAAGAIRRQDRFDVIREVTREIEAPIR